MNDAPPPPLPDPAELSHWLIREGLAGATVPALLGGLAARLTDQGMLLLRVSLGSPTLHPIWRGHLNVWRRATGLAPQDAFSHVGAADTADSGQAGNPFVWMLMNDKRHLRLDPIKDDHPFDIVRRLGHEEGATDYAAWSVPLGNQGGRSVWESWRSGQAGAMSISFATDRPGGFRDAEIGLLDSLLPTLALGVRAAVASTVATSALETYLGPDAAQRVLSGEIIRGTTDTIDAAICYADLSGFTAVSDTLSAEDLVTTINAYMDCMALPFTSRGGEVLKFTGDGMLASFQLADRDHADVCRTALDAVEDAQDRVLALNAKRMERGQDIMGLDMALHLGEVRYGNVGAADRLDFTVIGPTVNEASRIEALSGTLDYPVLISETFARAALHCGARLSEIGRVRLRGVRTPRLLFTLKRYRDTA